MGQFIFFTLFIITLLAGAFAYFAPLQKPINPVKFVMDNSGYTDKESHNRKLTQQLNMRMTNGLVQIRRKMNDFAVEQGRFIDTIQGQQELLNSTGKDASDIMLLAKQGAGKASKDVLQLRALASEMQDQQRLLVARGQDLIVLNNQLTRNRQWIADQIDAANISNEDSLRTIQQHYEALESQASDFFDKVSQHNQEVREQMVKMQEQMQDLANNAMDNNALQQQNTKERIGRMLGREHENMLKLEDTEERSRNLVKDSQQNLQDSKDLFNDSLQRSQDMIDDERQKVEDQKWISQQRVADQVQRLKDQEKR